ncbi:TPM domain-containing protein [bacterium]|nr:TPM domain-containing protein [bacterium]
MKPLFSDTEHRRLEAAVAAMEKKTGTQIVPAVVKRSDSYAELPWIAFALGAGLAGLLLVLLDLPLSDWNPRVSMLLISAVILGAGAFFGLLTVIVPPFARLFLARSRADLEVRQYAATLFLERELFATKQRRGILLLVSIFEREVVILPDTGLASRLSAPVLEGVIGSMTPLLKKKRIADALDTGMKELSSVLVTSGKNTHTDNELPDRIIEEEGV